MASSWVFLRGLEPEGGAGVRVHFASISVVLTWPLAERTERVQSRGELLRRDRSSHSVATGVNAQRTKEDVLLEVPWLTERDRRRQRVRGLRDHRSEEQQRAPGVRMVELGRRSEDNTPRSAAAKSTQPPQLSVITPVFPTTAPYLHAAFDSLLRENQLAWQWEIQVDGESVDTLPAALLHHPNVRAEANGRWLGPAMTRNRALGRVDAPFVVALDADDLVEPGGLAALVEALSAN